MHTIFLIFGTAYVTRNHTMRFRTLLLMILLIPVTVPPSHAQNTVRRTYLSITGKDTTVYLWDETVSGDSRKITVTKGTQVAEIVSGEDYVTRSTHISDPSDKTDITITLKNGIYVIEGRFHGKNYHDTVNSKGYPWIQNISYSVGAIMKNRTSYKYECFRPDNLDFEQMQAEYSGETRFRTLPVRDIKITPGGLKSLFWSCRYYLDETGRYVGYRGVNGGPGTPETIIIPAE